MSSAPTLTENPGMPQQAPANTGMNSAPAPAEPDAAMPQTHANMDMRPYVHQISNLITQLSTEIKQQPDAINDVSAKMSELLQGMGIVSAQLGMQPDFEQFMTTMAAQMQAKQTAVAPDQAARAEADAAKRTKQFAIGTVLSIAVGSVASFFAIRNKGWGTPKNILASLAGGTIAGAVGGFTIGKAMRPGIERDIQSIASASTSNDSAMITTALQLSNAYVEKMSARAEGMGTGQTPQFAPEAPPSSMVTKHATPPSPSGSHVEALENQPAGTRQAGI